MNDIWDWEQEAKLDALLAPFAGGAFPPGLLEAHMARKKAMHSVIAAEIARMFAEAASDPAMLVRLNRPI